MSFALPTITTVVDKYPSNFLFGMVQNEDQKNLPPTMWQILSKYDSLRELIRIARMEDIFDDPQANLTLFIPTDLSFPRITLQSCVGYTIEEKEVLAINFELARKMVNSITIPGILSTTMMMQSAYTKFKTRDSVNTLTTTTPHCVQFEPQTYNKPPFGIMLNGKARILIPDIITSNGIVHTIDKFPYN